jgi:hypothetical protein
MKEIAHMKEMGIIPKTEAFLVNDDGKCCEGVNNHLLQ